MQQDLHPSFFPQLCHRFSSLIWSSIDAGLYRGAIFYAERYYALDQNSHDARHLYATALLRGGQAQSALRIVNGAQDEYCVGCLELKAKCCTALGRHRQAQECLEGCLSGSQYAPSASMGLRTSAEFPDQAVFAYRMGTSLLKGRNDPKKAQEMFQRALGLNPMMWDALEGMCASGHLPPVDHIFPEKPLPVQRGPPTDPPPIPEPAVPMATGAGFFTPVGYAGNVNACNLFGRPNQTAHPFRIKAPDPAAAEVPNGFPAYPNRLTSMQPPPAPIIPHAQPQPFMTPVQPQPSHLLPQPQLPIPVQSNARPLSSAEETGPAPKKLRHTTQRVNARTVAPPPHPEVVKAEPAQDEIPAQKARARTALRLANMFSSSSGRHEQPPNANAKNGGVPIPSAPTKAGSKDGATRRSTRLLGGAGSKQNVKPTRERRRQAPHGRTKSAETDMDEDHQQASEPAYSPSPPAAPHSPRSEAASPPPSAPAVTWTAADQQAAEEAYRMEQADLYIYELMRLFAKATRALAGYDIETCLDELGKLPPMHQRSPWVMAMVGRAHYERCEYNSAERAFQAARAVDPYRVWDMEYYSTLLWHLGKNVQLSFLAQELLAIDPRAPQAWIAVGNCFALQKERKQALTCFRRAAQLDSWCAYAYTLSGHEMLDESVEKAMAFFQSALRADERHYNAWYGLGSCYLKMNKIRLADYHYRKANEICPANAVLVSCIAVCAERQNRRTEAMRLLNDAIRLAPDNVLSRYRRAKMLIASKRYSEAIQDLERLRDLSPGEANIVFQLAKAYRLVGNTVKATQLLAVARDLEPKNVAKVQKLLETVKDETGEEGVEGQEQMDVG